MLDQAPNSDSYFAKFAVYTEHEIIYGCSDKCQFGYRVYTLGGHNYLYFWRKFNKLQGNQIVLCEWT